MVNTSAADWQYINDDQVAVLMRYSSHTDLILFNDSVKRKPMI